MKRYYWNGDVGWYDSSSGKGITPERVKTDLLDANGEDIEVELTTFGGNFFDGVAIMELLRGYKGKKTGIGSSIVASAGTVISLGFDKFIVKPTTMYMIHNAQGWSSGDHNQMREDADLYERMSNLIADEYVKKTGKKLADVKKLMDDETWLMGKEIVENGFADAMADDEAQGTSMMLVLAQKQFRDRVTMWAKAKPEPTASLEEMKEVEAIIESGSFDKLAPVPTDAELSVKKYPIAKNGKVFRSSLRAISARAAKDDPELAKWATAMIAKIDAKGAIKVNEEEIVAYLKDKPAVFARVAEASGHGAMLATPEQKSAVEMKVKLVAANVPDPLAKIAELEAVVMAVETDRVTNIMDATFGPVKLATGKENTLRSYAGVKLAGVKAVDLAAKIEEFKKDTLALKLAGELMDANSEVNLIGFIETKVTNKAPDTYDGVPVVTV
jgi:ATP-dependent protease ClpP protease subunit